MTTNRSFSVSVVLLVLIGVLSKGIGFLREIVVALLFGTSAVYDRFLVAVAIPLSITAILSSAIPNVFVPLFVRLQRSQGETRAWRFFRSYLTRTTFLTVLICIALFLFAPILIKAVLPTATDSVLQKDAILILRLTLGLILLAVWESIFRGTLNSYHRYVSPAVAALIGNVFMVIFLAIFASSLVTKALAGGYLISLFIPVAIMGALLLGRYRISEIPGREDSHSAVILISSGYVLLVEFAAQIFLYADRFLVAYIPVGAISALAYAAVIIQIPTTLFSLPVGAILLPALSEATVRHDYEKVTALIVRTISFAIFLMIPTLVGLVIFAKPIVSLLYQRAAFSSESTAMTVTVLRWYAVALVPLALQLVLWKIFFALGKNRELVLTMFLGAAFKIVLNIFLVHLIGYQGLAIASGVVVFFIFIVLLSSLRSVVPSHEIKYIVITFKKTVLATAPAAALSLILFFGWRELINSYSQDWILKVTQLVVSVSLAAGAFTWVSLWLKIPEACVLVDSLRKVRVSQLLQYSPLPK